jgi:hypothetical protein
MSRFRIVLIKHQIEEAPRELEFINVFYYRQEAPIGAKYILKIRVRHSYLKRADH